MGNTRETQYLQAVQGKKMKVSDMLEQAYTALVEKGYNLVNQIVGYIMPGDPIYITSHKSTRSLIIKVERDEILGELMAVHIDVRLRQAGVSHCICCWQVGVRIPCEFYVPEQDSGNLAADSVLVPCPTRDHSATVIVPQRGMRRSGNGPS